MFAFFRGVNTSVDEPNLCPHCHVVNEPKALYAVASTDIYQNKLLLVGLECANKSCKRVFFAEYREGYSTWEFKRFLDGYPKGPDWPKPILELKDGSKVDSQEQTRFIKTYLQSLKAEHNNLDEIAGMGYRKSIEYLVKDWAIQNNSEKREEIEKMWLGQVISNYYTGDLKDILERATWLGNDQSHYNRLFEEFDLNDLKELIALIMVELDTQFKRRHYIENIQKRK